MDAFTRHCHGTLAEWLKYDPVLAKGEMVLVATDATKPEEYNAKKVGDGIRKFSQLPLLGFDCLQSTGTSTLFPMSQDAVTKSLATLNENIQNSESDILALQCEVWPLEVNLTVSPSVIEVGKSTVINAAWTVSRSGKSVLADSVLKWLTPAPAADLAKSTATKAVTISPSGVGVSLVSLSATYAGITTIASKNVTAVNPTYFGKVAATGDITEATVKGLTKQLLVSRESQHSGISLTDQRIVLCYPQSYGLLTSIKDGNGFENLSSYTRSSIKIGSVDCYLYVLTNPVTATSVTQIFS